MLNQLTAAAVAEMESELTLLRTENNNLRTQLVLAEAERDAKKAEVASVLQKWQEELIRATQIETIMSQVSMGLVAGLGKMQDQRMRARAARQASQESDLQVGQQGHSPVYVPREGFADGGLVRPAGDVPASEPGSGNPPYARRPSPNDRQAIERLGPPRARSEGLVQQAREPRTDIVDERLPKVDIRTDDDALRDLANKIAPASRA